MFTPPSGEEAGEQAPDNEQGEVQQ
jgi:hypothetical protein